MLFSHMTEILKDTSYTLWRHLDEAKQETCEKAEDRLGCTMEARQAELQSQLFSDWLWDLRKVLHP